ncbi:MAG TPA: AtpZ/AtpI family protein [Alphaproteobacteria bacterium]|nr:AtpZ/AtpI family protein [Alphaproteobacteria bacterium]
MSEPEPGRRPPSSLEDLDARLREARGRQVPEMHGRDGGGNDLGIAWRIGIELVSALVVGVGIGYLLDRWLGTRPWLMVVFFVLGSAAGLLNVFRAVKGLGGAVGYKRAPDESRTRRDAPQARTARRDEDDDEDDET